MGLASKRHFLLKPTKPVTGLAAAPRAAALTLLVPDSLSYLGKKLMGKKMSCLPSWGFKGHRTIERIGCIRYEMLLRNQDSGNVV